MSIRLTQYSHGAGCGCKLSPQVLDTILAAKPDFIQPGLLVGNEGRDDAAALELPDGNILLSTTDFFMPIVDDPYDFGRIAATNAISDIYAMGGRPILAIALLGWPIDKLAPEIAGDVLAGARSVCREAGMQIAGGHSIDAPEPIFGLAVNGLVAKTRLKSNSGARPGDLIFLTKPLGIDIMATAEKKGILTDEDRARALQSMTTLNSPGEQLSSLSEVHAMTDVTGFGLAGHLLEVMRNSNTAAILQYDRLPFLCDLSDYLAQNSVPGGGKRNWQSYGKEIDIMINRNLEWIQLKLADPQTSGGLLLFVDPQAEAGIRQILADSPFPQCMEPVGYVTEYLDSAVRIE